MVVDWERKGKERRQRGFDTQIGDAGVAELRAIRAVSRVPVVCRVNQLSDETLAEIELALANGADEILLPMVRRAEPVERLLELLRGRAPWESRSRPSMRSRPHRSWDDFHWRAFS